MDHSASALTGPAPSSANAPATAPGVEALPEWQIEEVALQLGWLRECPYHGEPFQALEPPATGRTGARHYGGEHLLAAAAALASAYGGCCRFCERDDRTGG